MATTINANLLAALASAGMTQTKAEGGKKTRNDAYPVYPSPAEKTMQILYIPSNVATTLDDGTVVFNGTRFYAHQIQDGANFRMVRCSNVLINDDNREIFMNSLGLDGTPLEWDGKCPYCEAMNDLWSYYNAHKAMYCKQYAIDPESKEAYKEESKRWLEKTPIKTANPYVIFPVLVLNTDATTYNPNKVPSLVKDEKTNGFGGKVYYYVCREDAYVNRFITTTRPNPAGHFFLMNYKVDGDESKLNAQQKKMRLVKDMKVEYLDDNAVLGSDPTFITQYKTYFDSLCADFTVDNCQQNIIMAEAIPMAKMRADAKRLMAEPEKLHLQEQQSGMLLGSSYGNVTPNNAIGVGAGANATLAQFGNAQAALPSNGVPAQTVAAPAPAVGATPVPNGAPIGLTPVPPTAPNAPIPNIP